MRRALLILAAFSFAASGQILAPILHGRNASAPPATNPVARYYFNAGSGTAVADASGNGHDITIQQDATTPAWGNKQLAFGADDRLFSPVLPLDLAESWTIMASVLDNGTAGTILSLGRTDTDWQFMYLIRVDSDNNTFSVNGSAGGNFKLPKSAFCPIFISYDKATGNTTFYRPDSGATSTQAAALGGATNVKLGWGTAVRATPLGQVDRVAVAQTAVWDRLLSQSEMDAETAYEHSRLGRMTFPASIDDRFQRADTALGTIGTADSGWPWDYRESQNYALAMTNGRILNNRWVSAAGDVLYANAILSKTVDVIGGTFAWIDNGAGDPAESAVYAQTIGIDDSYIRNMIHMRVSRSNLNVQIWQDGGPVATLINEFGLGLLDDGTLYTMEATVSGQTLTITLNGQTYTATNALVATMHGKYCYWEHYVGNPTESNLQITHIWAR